MYQSAGFLTIFFAVCYGSRLIPQGTFCDEKPTLIGSCVHIPIDVILNSTAATKCDEKHFYSDCQRMSCIFREMTWLSRAKVDRRKVGAYFDEFAVNQPEWSSAVQQSKSDCLDKVLPAQGIALLCPAYDIASCITNRFLKNAPPSHWSTSKYCEATRTYITSCPICPAECYESPIPFGSCNACYAS